jgi:predicted acetyltransferase
MTSLVRPDGSLWQGWALMMKDFGGWDEAHGSGHWFLDAPVELTEEGCLRFVTAILEKEPAAEPPATRVASTFFWITDGAHGGGDLIGFLNLRHTLNDWLLEEGGHIGYSICPSRRREGHATRALALAVRHAAELGIERALVTCDDDNVASARTIEKCGAVLEDVRNGKRRYWIATRG